ncbi:hypothetical protein D0784_07635 [Vibrio campbellii]|uniref:hypothetical protein n=1 Tax=Vibrio campbellii TaxID=680 RepID=UPI000EFB693E|nr:hypothetical protein [Vibrio campbellii]AYO09292.1 hypothetical protein D0784_07635 [Vibrio campbellii]HDM8237129.1 hypothetical protein [Vibrio campbellii]
MKVEIGIHTSAELLQELKEQRIQFNPFALQLFEDQVIQTKQHAQTLSLSIVTPSDLGAPFGATLSELLEHAAQRDLEPCPLAVAPYLLLQGILLTKGEYVTLASLPLAKEETYPRGLYLREQDDGLWLRGYRCDDDFIFPPSMKFVFIDLKAPQEG